MGIKAYVQGLLARLRGEETAFVQDLVNSFSNLRDRLVAVAEREEANARDLASQLAAAHIESQQARVIAANVDSLVGGASVPVGSVQVTVEHVPADEPVNVTPPANVPVADVPTSAAGQSTA